MLPGDVALDVTRIVTIGDDTASGVGPHFLVAENRQETARG
jgi:hypothetical protein